MQCLINSEIKEESQLLLNKSLMFELTIAVHVLQKLYLINIYENQDANK